MSEGLQLTIDAPADVRVQMERDAVALAQAESAGPGAPRLRLFTIAPAGITLGVSQSAERELDLERCRRAGMRWAHRPTGGRAILHDREWTFSLLAGLGPGGWAADARAAMARTSGLLAAALRTLGMTVEFAGGQSRLAGPRARAGPAPPCFATHTRDELLLDGRKFAGIAQRVSRGIILQQGSLLLGAGHERLADFVAEPAAGRDALRTALELASAHAGSHFAAPPGLGLLADAIAATASVPVRRIETAPVEGREPRPGDRGILPWPR